MIVDYIWYKATASTALRLRKTKKLKQKNILEYAHFFSIILSYMHYVLRCKQHS